MTGTDTGTDTGTGLFGLIRLSLRHFRFVYGVALAAGVASVAVGFLLPRWYVARASLLPPHESRNVINLGGLASILRIPTAFPFSGGIELVDIYLAILESDTLGRTLVEDHDLVDRFDVRNPERALKALRGRTTVQLSERGVLEIMVESKDPRLAADLANAHVDELDRLFQKSQTTIAGRQRVFLETRLKWSATRLDSLQAKLVDLQSHAGITALSQDATEAAMAAGELMGRKLALQVRIQMFEQLKLDIPLRRELELELRALNEKIAELPGLGAELGRQLRDVRIQETLHVALARQLEIARLEEVKDTSRVQVLDRAQPPVRHARPRKSLLGLAGALLGGLTALGWVGYRDR